MESSYIVHDLLPPEDVAQAFEQLYSEVTWQHMYHASGLVPRLVCSQGEISSVDGSMPIYRHPADRVLPLFHWTPTVLEVKTIAEKRIGHELNHVLIQLYRGGQDFISEHSDKTLDVAHGSNITNVSFGAERTLRLRSKRADLAAQSSTPSDVVCDDKQSEPIQREVHRIALPHNSMYVMSLETNRRFLHAIQPDKRREAERSEAELAYGGMRISLTFRRLATFVSHDSRVIWGQGAVGKSASNARPSISGHPVLGTALIAAFAKENHEGEQFDWEQVYGPGSDVLHTNAEHCWDKPMLFLSGIAEDDQSLVAQLQAIDVDVEIVQPPVINGVQLEGSQHRRQSLRDTDKVHTVVYGMAHILHYLEQGRADKSRPG